MDTLLSVFLPLSLGIIMLSLGLGLKVADFTRILQQPRALIAGLLAQVFFLPIVAYGFVLAFGLDGEMAFGVMILSVCPGGVTSNILTKLVGGTLALSISLTGLISLLSVITVPLLVVFWAGQFLEAGALNINVTGLAITMFAITAVPVIIGIMIRAATPNIAAKIEGPLSGLATALFALIVVAAIALSWDVLTANIGTLGPLMMGMILVLMGMGWLTARLIGLPVRDRAAISMETGIQNSTVGITLANLIYTDAVGGLSAIALPAAMYGVLMYLAVIPCGALMRRATKGAE